MVWSRFALFAVLGTVFCVSVACKRGAEPTDPVSSQPPAVRIATSFVHCVEAGKAQCVHAQQSSTSWNALFLLSWLGSGSPVAILEKLPAELASRGDHRLIEARFVDEVERYATTLRGAECGAEHVEPFEPLVAEAARVATDRLESLGMMRGGMPSVIHRLSEEALTGLRDGHLVHMRCTHDPHHVYLAVRGPDQGRPAVVGMTTLWPAHLGGARLAAEQVGERLRSQGLGLSTVVVPVDDDAVDRWLPFRVEEF
jgi:hypothetical protein